jgi:hypothetical protein
LKSGKTTLTYGVMRRRFMSLLVAVLVGAMPVAHEICLARCSGKAATTAHSHHHDDAAGPEHRTAGHAMASHVAMMGQHHGPAAVKEMARATQCCASVSATPPCCRTRDESTLVPTLKRVLEPPQTTVAHVIAIVGPPVGDNHASSVATAIRPPVSLARLTPLRV